MYLGADQEIYFAGKLYKKMQGIIPLHLGFDFTALSWDVMPELKCSLRFSCVCHFSENNLIAVQMFERVNSSSGFKRYM